MSRRGTSLHEGLFASVEAIGAPILIVETDGKVLHANSDGRSTLERDPRGIAQSLARAVVGQPNDSGWDLIPLVGEDESPRYLAIGRPAPRAGAPAVSVPAVSAKWRLTARQAEVLGLIARGMTNTTIATILGITVATVEFHVSRIFIKAGVENRASLIAGLQPSD